MTDDATLPPPLALYHACCVVDDVEAAVAVHERALGLRFAVVETPTIPMWTSHGEMTVTVPITYSTTGPMHLELVGRVEGTIWDHTPEGGIHHVGAWTSDLHGDAARLEGRGLPVVAAGWRAGAWSLFTYHRNPAGGYVELVDTLLQPAFERWIAGGRYLPG